MALPLFSLLLEDMLGKAIDEAILVQAMREVARANMSPRARSAAGVRSQV